MRRVTFFMMCTLMLAVVLVPPVFATDITIPFNHADVEHLPDLIGENATEDNTAGVVGLKKIVNVLLSSVGLLLRTVALFIIFAAGFKLVTSQAGGAEEGGKQGKNVLYVIAGLLIFGLSTEFVYQYLYLDSGEYILDKTGEASLEVASALGLRIKELLNLFLAFSGAAAILMLVVAGLRLVLNFGNEDEAEKQKKLVLYTALGIIVIGFADTLVNQIIFPSGGYEGVNISALEVQLEGISNYVLGFLGIVVFVTFVVSGIVMVANFGNDDIVGKAKTAMKNVAIGSIIAFSAYTIVATVIRTLLAA